MEDRWAKLEEIVRRVVREELSTWNPQKQKSKVSFKDGKFTGLGEIEMAALTAAYPGVDVAKQINEMCAWLVMNPEDSPKSNYGAFINRWLTKHQDRHSLRVVPAQREVVVPKLCAYCESPAVGTVNAIKHCSKHALDAMDEKPRKRIA